MASVAQANFNLQKRTGLKEVDINRRETKFNLATGLRDIGQARERGLENTVNNALQRGIFRSGITEENQTEVKKMAGQAEGDLRSQVGFALEQLANRENYLRNQRFDDGSGGGASAFASAIDRLLRKLNEQSQGAVDFGDMTPPTMVWDEETSPWAKPGYMGYNQRRM